MLCTLLTKLIPFFVFLKENSEDYKWNNTRHGTERIRFSFILYVEMNGIFNFWASKNFVKDY